MKITVEINYGNKEMHESNVKNIKCITEKLLGEMTKDVADKIIEIYITDKFREKCNEHNGIVSKDVAGTIIPIQDKFLFILNYEKCVIYDKENPVLCDIVEHVILHELIHVESNIYKKKKAMDYLTVLEVADMDQRMIYMMYDEFIAEYNAQKRYPILWSYNRYSIDTFIDKINVKHSNINNKLDLLHGKSVISHQQECKDLSLDVMQMLHTICYDISIMVARCLADNVNNVSDLNFNKLDVKIRGVIENVVHSIVFRTEEDLLKSMIKCHSILDGHIRNSYFDISEDKKIIKLF